MPIFLKVGNPVGIDLDVVWRSVWDAPGGGSGFVWEVMFIFTFTVMFMLMQMRMLMLIAHAPWNSNDFTLLKQ